MLAGKSPVLHKTHQETNSLRYAKHAIQRICHSESMLFREHAESESMLIRKYATQRVWHSKDMLNMLFRGYAEHAIQAAHFDQALRGACLPY